MAQGNESQRVEDEDAEFKRSLVSAVKDGIYAAVVLLILTGIEWLVEHLPLNKTIKAFVTTVHEWSLVGVFTVFAIKSFLRVALKSWRQTWKSIQADD